MREFQQKGKYRRILFSPLSVIILFLLILFFARAVWNVYQKATLSAANALSAEIELHKLQERKNLLDSEVKRLSTDTGVDEEIRAKYSVSKPGENIIIIVPDNVETEETQPVVAETLWTKIKNFFLSALP